jgi:hypothetical protein
MNSDAPASHPFFGDENSNPSVFFGYKRSNLLFGQNASVVVTPSDLVTVQPPKYRFGARCRWIPMPQTDWGTVIGQILIPEQVADHETPQWSWVYLLLLDADSPSRGWIVADWVGEQDLEPIPPDQEIQSDQENL